MASVSEIRSLIEEIGKQQKKGASQCWQSPDGDLVVGLYPNPMAKFDFGLEAFVDVIQNNNGHEVEANEKSPKQHVDVSHEVGRRTRDLIIVTPSKEIVVGSVKQALFVYLNEIEIHFGGSLNKLCDLAKGRGRTKSMIALSIADLYGDQNLSEFNQKLPSGHFVATNNSEVEVQRFLKASDQHLKLSKNGFSILKRDGKKWM
jgi:hypothetical protein